MKIASGDSVHFIPTDESHNVESIEGKLPTGAASPGTHGHIRPVGLVVVGEPTNKVEAAAVVQKGKAKQKLETLFTKIGS
ncbi:MAG TPA: hypothetical protein VFZ03_03100 [Dongiaceae bacterium]